jgi:hypothetical protein
LAPQSPSDECQQALGHAPANSAQNRIKRKCVLRFALFRERCGLPPHAFVAAERRNGKPQIERPADLAGQSSSPAASLTAKMSIAAMAGAELFIIARASRR